MVAKTFDNRFRHGKWHFELVGTSPATAGMSGARFEKATLNEEIGPEIVVMLTDLTPFAYELKREPFALRLKSGAVQTSVGPVLFLLWWIPPVTNGKPFALYEQILNPTQTGVLGMLRQIARQTHLHLLLIGPGQALLDVYEFESTFGLEKLISVSECACREYGGMDFTAAKEEYDRTSELMELFRMSELGTEEEIETESEEDTENEDQFLVAQSSRALIDSAVWLAGRLLTHPACTRDKRAALARALIGLGRLPRPTPGLTVDFGFSTGIAGGDMRCWSVHLDETELMWSAGGYVHGPYGGDSFTSFQFSLLCGSEDTPIGSVGTWLELKEYLKMNINVLATDASDEDFWERNAPHINQTTPEGSSRRDDVAEPDGNDKQEAKPLLANHRTGSSPRPDLISAAMSAQGGQIPLEDKTTFHLGPRAGDFLLWVRCPNPSSDQPEFFVPDFWEFREGDRLLITNREEDYPASVEQMEEAPVPIRIGCCL